MNLFNQVSNKQQTNLMRGLKDELNTRDKKIKREMLGVKGLSRDGAEGQGRE